MRRVFRRKPKHVVRQRDWVITYVVAGTDVKYLRLDQEKVWAWTKSISRAQRFTDEESARRMAESTEMAWRFRYELRNTAR